MILTTLKRTIMNAKRLLMAVVAVLMVTACNTNKPNGKLLDPSAMLYVNVKDELPRAESEGTETEERLLTPAEIVKESLNFCIESTYGGKDVLVGISDEMKDYDNNRIKMWGQQIITEKGELEEYFIRAKDVRICNGKYPDKDNHRNIIAYIPNKVMQEGWVKIKAAYDAGNYDEVYRIFQEVYTAIPITPSEYAKLRAEGKN